MQLLSAPDHPMDGLGCESLRDRTVMVVDDDDFSVRLMEAMLSPHCRVAPVRGGGEALRSIDAGVRPDLILLDLLMPDLDGCAVMRRLREIPSLARVPIILVSGCEDPALIGQGLALGAIDMLPKPMSRDLLLQKVRHHVLTGAEQVRLQSRIERLQGELLALAERNAKLELACMCLPIYLTMARDADTGHHMRRTQAYLTRLVDRMRGHEAFAARLHEDAVRHIVLGAALHDIGKVGLPDRILLKADRFTAEERALMEAHANIGGNAIASTQAVLGDVGDFLQAAQDMARHHHERWDGGGYPSHLSGAAIPLAARIMAVVDVFDALVSKRVYKSAMGVVAAREVMLAERGGLFDPQVLDLFLVDYLDYVQIALSCPDLAELGLPEAVQHVEFQPEGH